MGTAEQALNKAKASKVGKDALKRKLDKKRPTYDSRTDIDIKGNARRSTNQNVLKTLHSAFAAKGQDESQISESIKSLARSVDRTKEAKSKITKLKDLDAGKYDTAGMYDKSKSYKSQGGILGSLGDLVSQNKNTRSILQQRSKNTPEDKAKKAAIQRRIQRKKLQDA